MGSARVIELSDLLLLGFCLFCLTKCPGTIIRTGIPYLGRSTRGQKCIRVFIEF